MLFNSYEYIFLFLPITIVVYFLLTRRSAYMLSKVWLVCASLFFYVWWNVKYLPLILISIAFNFAIGTALIRKNGFSHHSGKGKSLLLIGIVLNLGLLGYFKYVDFFIANLNAVLATHYLLQNVILPLGISFFTFTQIAFLVDAYRGKVTDCNVINYALFVTYFPHLLAGPILHHKEMMPQFDDAGNKVHDYENVSRGLFLFFIGCFKKVVIADTFAYWANNGFDYAVALNFVEAWVTSLSYTLQIYFDFSGYTDMALGAALMFNIRLPINFNSPYKAVNIREFWLRWHITLMRFLRDYVYIPLGGNRVTEARLYGNLMLTFLIGGLWHGAGWTFIFWGFLHGAAIVIHRIWRRMNLRLHTVLAWFFTFNFVNVAWVFFRAKTFDDAVKVLAGMVGLNGVVLPKGLLTYLRFLEDAGVKFGAYVANINANTETLVLIAIFMAVSLFSKNSMAMVKDLGLRWRYSLAFSTMVILSILFINKSSEFIYFRF